MNIDHFCHLSTRKIVKCWFNPIVEKITIPSKPEYFIKMDDNRLTY